MTNKWDAFYVKNINKLIKMISKSNEDKNGEECSAASDDLVVFHKNDSCKWNEQIMSALVSTGQRWACDRRNEVIKQLTRQTRKLENIYNARHC